MKDNEWIFYLIDGVIIVGLVALTGVLAFWAGRNAGINQAAERGVVPQEYNEYGEVIAWQLAPLKEVDN